MLAEVLVAVSLSVRRARRGAPFLGALLVVGLAAPGAWAQEIEEDPVALQKITEMNKKALEAYEALDFEQARKILKDALDACAAANFDKHPIKARTHVHMGAVLFGGFKQRDLAIKQFKKALEIEPDIKLTKSVATPEVQSAFEEAKASAPATEPPPPSSDGAAPEASARESTGAAGAAAGLSHVPVSQGRRGQAIPIVATLEPSLSNVSKVVLAYRAEGNGDFVAHELTKSGGSYAGEIPGSATNGATVAYFIEAQAADETVVSAAGSQEEPFTVRLLAIASKSSKKDEGEEGDDEDAAKIFFSVGAGLSVGSASGSGEVLTQQSASGFASGGGHLLLEGGYFLSPQLRLSLAARIQFYSGPNGYYDATKSGACGSDNYCQPASGAFALFAKGSWFLRTTGLVRPYVGAALGGGQIRHVVSFSEQKGCGKTGTESCKDTALAGPIFIGPHAGVLVAFSRRVGAVAELGTELGISKFTFNFDFNAGVALTF